MVAEGSKSAHERAMEAFRVADGKRADAALAETIRGHNMADSRARDLNAATRENKPPSAAERRALGFYVRAQGAAENIEKMEKEMSGKDVFSQAYYKLAPNVIQSEFNQAYMQSQRAFTEARLRKDSGAAIPPYEYEADSKTYFPQPGDTPAVLAQKKKGRDQILRALHLEAGRAVRDIGNEPGDLKQPAAPGATVRLKAPNGEIQEVSADQAAHYKRLGAVEVKGN
jgi:hypothetical protein